MLGSAKEIDAHLVKYLFPGRLGDGEISGILGDIVRPGNHSALRQEEAGE